MSNDASQNDHNDTLQQLAQLNTFVNPYVVMFRQSSFEGRKQENHYSIECCNKTTYNNNNHLHHQ